MQKFTFIWTYILASISITKSDYTAAVLEYQPIISTSPNATVEVNLEEYARYINDAKQNKTVNIIVFPEYGLTGFFSDPAPYGIVIPNRNEGPNFQNYWLEKLSNAAKANEIYVVVNLVEKAANNKNETIYYNTNVMFDRSGKIGAKYRKINLFNEPLLTPGNSDENQAVFSTDFGVTFGMVIGYDLLFYNPSRSILANSSVADVILSSAWYSALPFYHSLSYHLAYAQANRVNLLASNLNSLDKGVSGSGIYGAKGNIFSYSLPGTSTSKMLLSGGLNTPREDFVPFDLSLSKFNTSRVFESNRYKFQTLNLTSDSVVQQKVCYGLFCCQVNLTMGTEVNSSEVYQLMAYTGSLRLMDKTLPFVRICALLACESTDPRTCGNSAASSSTKFENISVTTDVCLGQKDFFQPLYLTTDLLPIYNTRYESIIKKYCTRLTLSTSREQKNVLAFGFYGSGGAMLNFSCFVVSFMVIVTYFI